jgi:hypothetical protein
VRNKLRSLVFFLLHVYNLVTIPWHVGLCGFEAYLLDRSHGIVFNGAYSVDESDTAEIKYYLLSDIQIIDYVYFTNFRLS